MSVRPPVDLVEPGDPSARRILITGRVQGVGFRPFVHNLAESLGITGWVRNGAGRVEILAEGERARLDAFEHRLRADAPPLARIETLASHAAARERHETFSIRTSEDGIDADVHIPPDVGLCDDCRRELHDPADRRFGYAFINCTQCGPRYTLIQGLPYDRDRTSMRGFQLCAPCDTEYRDVRDRRFHAEPVACARCGPELRLVAGRERVEHDDRRVLDRAVSVLRAGGIAAVKGIGGYHLLCDATSGDAVARLRARKRRPTKPLAVMFPHGRRNALDRVRAYVELAPEEAEALLSPARPIVLARRLPSDIAEDVASGLDELGVMLPYTPLHELLLAAFDAPLVATSGNPSGEPLVTTAEDAERELGDVADVFVHHDRPIVRPVDDAVVRRIAGRMRTIRIGRGLAPLEAELPRPAPAPILAVGGHMKNTVALAWGDRLVLSPHIGDLDGARSVDAFAATAEDLPALFRMTPEHLLADAHPDYASARWASGRGVPVSAIQHHAAHASAVAGEDPSVGRWLVFAWDGVGLGSDGTLWGGEGFVGRPGAWRRWSSFRPFRVPGATRSGREPWRSAAGMFWEAHLQEPMAIPGARHLARRAWEKGINSPATSAVGRIFDAAAAILLGLERYGHEAEGPMRLEALARGGEAVELPLARDERGVLRADWAPLLETLVDDAQPIEARAGALHASLVDAAVAQAEVARAELDVHTVGLAGGVFQNRKLTESLADTLSQRGFDVRLNELIPMGDGGLAYGQVMEYLGSLHGDR